MKTAVSLPDPLFDAAEQVAKRLGVSRSELYQRALRAFLAKHQSDSVTKAQSVINVSQLLTLDRRFLAGRVSRLPHRQMAALEDGLRLALSLDAGQHAA